MSTATAESKSAVAEMERPQTIAPGELEQQRFANDLPNANHADDPSAQTVPAPNTTDDADEIDEEDSQSELPGDPRPPHALQPPTATQY